MSGIPVSRGTRVPIQTLLEAAPRRLRRLFSEHEVESTQECDGLEAERRARWLGVDAGFEVFAMPDTSLMFQQRLEAFDSAVVVVALGGRRMSGGHRGVPVRAWG